MPTLRKAAGLVTNPNEINKREGSLEIADNVVIDADNIIESRRGFEDFGESFGNSNDRLNQLQVYKERILRHYNSTLQYDNTGSGDFQTFSGSYDEVEDGLRIKSSENNGNFYFTTKTGIKKISARTASDFSTASGFIEDAGGPKGINIEADLVFQSGGFLPSQSKVGYRVVWGKRDRNNTLILGTPSPRFVLTNTSEDELTPEEFECEFLSGTTSDYTSNGGNDRYIAFSSDNIDYFVYFTDGTTTTVPQDASTIGRTALEADITGLSSASDIATVFANVVGDLTDSFSVNITGAIVTVTSKDAGEDLVDAFSSADLTDATTTVLEQGTSVTGTTANAEVTAYIPQDVNDTDFFYQLYRTPVITATAGIDIDDIDPGENYNLVFESSVESSDLSNGFVVIEDITPESFRQNGAFLYTNVDSGQGILQANEKPPIATDIELFRNTTFYANTKTVHRQQLDLLSVIDFTSNTSSIVIGNEDQQSEFTFVGETQVQDIDTIAGTTLGGKYFLLNSARNEREYYVWYNTGSSTDPDISNRLGIEITIDSGDTDAQVATKTANILNVLNDFNATANTNTITITLARNGNTDNSTDGNTGFTFNAPSTAGDGEDSANNDVLLSSFASVGLALEETARSLVKIINLDNTCPVNAFYISGQNDLPGKILLESRTLEDLPFSVATTDPNIVDNFNPEIPVVETITAISAANPTQITSAGHGLVSGDRIFIYDTDSTPALSGYYTITVVDVNNFTVDEEVLSAGTTGKWFFADVESNNEEKPNRLYYSKTSQPEAVPLVNFLDIGRQDSAILRIISLRDNLFVLKEDGVYIVTGTTAPNFGSRLIDGDTVVISADSAVTLNNRIYALSEDGVVAITETGVQIVSRPIEDDILDITRTMFNNNLFHLVFGVSYTSDRSYLVWLPTLGTDTVATQAYRYNTFTNTWTRWTNSATCGIVNQFNDRLYLGAGERNYSYEERKNGDRTDFSDRSFELSIGNNSIADNSIILSNSDAVLVGDVILQTQYVTISQFNRLLLKLDIDLGLDDTDYFSTLEASAGDNLKLKLDDLNAKILADDSSGTVSSRTFSTDFETQQTEFNDLIDELNTPACDTNFTDYKKSENTVIYEGIITANDRANNTITLVFIKPFIVGTVRIFKGIQTDVQYAPQDFGAPDQLKQVREGTVIFDQNNFYSGIVSYSSDRSANFEEIPFEFAGSGYWGGNIWGEGTWGGEGNEQPQRTYIPQQKQRCRYLKVRFKHLNAREIFRIVGISLEPRPISIRGYR